MRASRPFGTCFDIAKGAPPTTTVHSRTDHFVTSSAANRSPRIAWRPTGRAASKTSAAPSTGSANAPIRRSSPLSRLCGQLQVGVAVRGAAFGELVHDVVEQQVVHGSSVNRYGSASRRIRFPAGVQRRHAGWYSRGNRRSATGGRVKILSR
jgi:hypothetical protein